MSHRLVFTDLSQAFEYFTSVLPTYTSDLRVQVKQYFKPRNSYVSLSGAMLHFVILASQEPEGQTRVSLNMPIDFLPSAECYPELIDHTVIFFLPRLRKIL